MNSLNSVLVEGVLADKPSKADSENGRSVTEFIIESARVFKQDDELKVQVSHFAIQTRDKQAEVALEYLDKGRGVRVVGRLKEEDGRVFIIAEHVEFKPSFGKKKEESVKA